MFKLWHSLNMTDVAKAGIFVLVGALLTGVFHWVEPATGRYQIILNKYPSYNIFDTATGKIYYWRGADGLKDIDDPIANKVINVINRSYQHYYPSSK